MLLQIVYIIIMAVPWETLNSIVNSSYFIKMYYFLIVRSKFVLSLQKLLFLEYLNLAYWFKNYLPFRTSPERVPIEASIATRIITENVSCFSDFLGGLEILKIIVVEGLESGKRRSASEFL